MDLISLLATVILITTIGTLVVAVAAYIAFKLRDKRRPRRRDPTVNPDGPHTPIFLQRYTPVDIPESPANLPPSVPTAATNQP
jgi:hypothetical protein